MYYQQKTGSDDTIFKATQKFVKKHFFCRQFFELGICSSFTQRTLLMMFFRSSKKHDNLIRLESKGFVCVGFLQYFLGIFLFISSSSDNNFKEFGFFFSSSSQFLEQSLVNYYVCFINFLKYVFAHCAIFNLRTLFRIFFQNFLFAHFAVNEMLFRDLSTFFYILPFLSIFFLHSSMRSESQIFHQF